MKTPNLIAKVSLAIYVDEEFDYIIPNNLRQKALPGTRALVDFRGKKIYGIITSTSNTSKVPRHKLKEILSIDDFPLVEEKLLSLAKWISTYYCAPLGMVLKNIIPSEIKKLKKRDFEKIEKLFSEQTDDEYLPTLPPKLNKAQQTAFEKIKSAINNNEFKTFLLFGVTGSGKTEVYIRSIQYAKEKNLQSIVIVPEIALTPQLIETFKTRFDDIAVFHSKLTPKERKKYWLGMKKGIYNIVIGARSAVFAPFEKLGLIIVDEEHEHTYKQYEMPFYNARDVAVVRAKINNACVVLGSATPSLESYTNALNKKYELLTLPERVDKGKLPKVNIIDMNWESQKNKGKNPILSQPLLDKINERLEKGEQSILFLNRRGYSTIVICEDCGWVAKCENCSITLTYHKNDALTRCHRCGFFAKVPVQCPKCSSLKIKTAGIGTEKVEKMLKKIFSNAKIERLDTDITKSKKSFEKVLENFRRGKTDILVGTQMIAKGLDLPNVTLVGIIAADMALNIPDFRSAEHTFQLITQVAGRTGRGLLEGEVVLQTFSPDLPVITTSAEQDYEKFYEYELAFREELKYPPINRFINIMIKGTDEVETARKANEICSEIKMILKNKHFTFKGPHPSPIRKLNKYFRWNMVISGKNIIEASKKIRKIVFREGVINYVSVDVDPLSLL